MKGPFVIVGRAHSGTSLLAEAFVQAGFWMGPDSDRATRDSKFFAVKRPAIRYLTQEAFHYGELGDESRQQVRLLMQSLVNQAARRCPDPDKTPAYGWKRPGSAFIVEILLDAVPDAKVVHLIRDGRDVMLSRANRPLYFLDDPFYRLLTFGDPNRKRYRGRRITPELIAEYRNDLEMEHWVTTVRLGLRGRRFPERYLELRYEDLCRSPGGSLDTVFDFLGLPLPAKARDWIAANASTDRIGKWQPLAAELHDAIAIGEPLLRELGYIAQPSAVSA